MEIIANMDIWCFMERISFYAWLITIFLFFLGPSALFNTSHICAGVTVNMTIFITRIDSDKTSSHTTCMNVWKGNDFEPSQLSMLLAGSAKLLCNNRRHANL